MHEFFDAQYPAGSRDDEYFDMMLSRAITAYVDREGARMLARDRALPVPEDAAERKQKALEQVKAMQRHAAPEEGSKSKAKKRGVFFYVRKAAAILLILAGITGIFTYATVDAVRTSIKNYFTSIVTDGVVSSEIRPDRGNMIPGDMSQQYFPEYMPKGFTIGANDDYGNMYHVQYVREEDDTVIDFWQHAQSNVIAHTESTAMSLTPIIINGMEGSISEGETTTILSWHTDDVAFRLSSTLPVEELILIAESVYIV